MQWRGGKRRGKTGKDKKDIRRRGGEGEGWMKNMEERRKGRYGGKSEGGVGGKVRSRGYSDKKWSKDRVRNEREGKISAKEGGSRLC